MNQHVDRRSLMAASAATILPVAGAAVAAPLPHQAADDGRLFALLAETQRRSAIAASINVCGDELMVSALEANPGVAWATIRQDAAYQSARNAIWERHSVACTHLHEVRDRFIAEPCQTVAGILAKIWEVYGDEDKVALSIGVDLARIAGVALPSEWDAGT